MCLIHCDVRIRTARSGGTGVCGRPGHHRRNRQQGPAGNRLRGETEIAWRSTAAAMESSTVYQTRDHGTDGVQFPGTDHRITETDHGPTVTTVPASRVRPLSVRTTVGDIQPGAGRGQENPEIGGNGRGSTTRTWRYDTGRQTIARRSPSCEDAVCECPVLGGSCSPNSPPAIRGPRTEVSRLPRLFRIGSNSVERLDCSNPDGHTTQAR